MPKDRGVLAARAGEAMTLLADVLAPLLRELLDEDGGSADGYYSQLDSPLGRRRHLRLVRQGALPGARVGRRIFIRRTVVHEYIDSEGRSSRAAPEAWPKTTQSRPVAGELAPRTLRQLDLAALCCRDKSVPADLIALEDLTQRSMLSGWPSWGVPAWPRRWFGCPTWLERSHRFLRRRCSLRPIRGLRLPVWAPGGPWFPVEVANDPSHLKAT
jgi:hypothetical protein